MLVGETDMILQREAWGLRGHTQCGSEEEGIWESDGPVGWRVGWTCRHSQEQGFDDEFDTGVRVCGQANLLA